MGHLTCVSHRSLRGDLDWRAGEMIQGLPGQGEVWGWGGGRTLHDSALTVSRELGEGLVKGTIVLNQT